MMFLTIWIFLTIAQTIWSENVNQFISPDWCKIECGDKPHTLCDKRIVDIKHCGYADAIISDSQWIEMKNMLILGHNGLRNRIAGRMNVANMVKMVWNDNLALMAEKYILKCTPFETDRCTLFPKPHAPWELVAQNRYIQQYTHYPNILIENALRAWYLEKDNMTSPTYKFNGMLQAYIGALKQENNFSHMAAPTARQIGCAFRRFETGYILICNYFPFFRSSEGTSFVSGEPGSICPIHHPLRNSRESFSNLCIGAERNTAATILKPNLIIVFLLSNFV